MKFGFVFTNYNNSGFTKGAIKSIINNDILNETYIVIVDNNSEDTDIKQLNLIYSEYPQIKIFFNEKNIGYFKGLNIGIEHLRKHIPDIKYIIIGNNDLVFPKGFLDTIKNNELIFDQYAVISPDIITIDGVHQNPHSIKGSGKIRELIYDLYYCNYELAQIIQFVAKKTKRFTDRKDEESYEIAQIIHQGYGACYILGPVFFEHFENLFAPTFLMGEEYFLSYQLEEKQLQIYYDPSIKVEHHDHATVSKMPTKYFWEISKQSHKIYRKLRPISKKISNLSIQIY